MAITTQSIHLIKGTESSGSVVYSFLTDGAGNNVCIKDFPDLTNGDKDQVETTTLCDTAHQYIEGLENLPEELEFTANFDNVAYDYINSLTSEDGYYGIQLGTATGNPRWLVKGHIRAELKGAGVGDVLEMVIKIRPTSTITKENVA